MSGKKREYVPFEIIEGLEDVTCRTCQLAEALECAYEAVRSERADSGDFIGGTLAILMREADEVFDKASGVLSAATRKEV